MKKVIGGAVILFSIVVSSLFIKYSVTEDKYEYFINKYDNDKLTYAVESAETVELYDLENSEAQMLMALSIILSVLSIVYVIMTYSKTNNPS